MARWRKKFRRNLKRKMKRRYKKKYRARRRISRPRPVTGRSKLKGYRSRLNTKPEMKWTLYNWLYNVSASTTSWSTGPQVPVVLWSNNGYAFDGVTPFYTLPEIGGTFGDGVIGSKYNSLFATVSFGLAVNPLNVTTFYDWWRILVVRERQKDQIISTTTLLRDPSAFFSDVDASNWDVQYDRIMPINTGWTFAATADPEVNGMTSIQAKPKKFRFVIPLKKTMNTNTMGVGDVSFFPKSMYIVIYAREGSCRAVGLTASYFYRDP